MIITRREYQALIRAARHWARVTPRSSDTGSVEVEALTHRIEKHINQVDEINGVKAERISIDVCAN